MKNMIKNIVYVYWLSSLKGLGPVAIKALIKHFGSAIRVFNATDREIVEFIRSQKTLRDPMAKILIRGRDKIREAREEVSLLFEKAARFQAEIISIENLTYPVILKEGNGEPPPILYVKGDISRITSRTVAIVGTRKASSQGLSLAYSTASGLADDGWTIISGMASGVDASAHEGALAAQGSTVAVLGCGVERAYPPQSKKLYEEICKRGAVVSEFPFGTPPSGNNLRKRNKTTVSFSQALILVEAPLNSGAMIAVKFAKEQSKPIFCFAPKDVQREETSGIVEVLASGKGMPIYSTAKTSQIVTAAVFRNRTDFGSWDTFVTQSERIAIKQNVKDTKQNWLSTTLSAQREKKKGDYTAETEALLTRLQKLYRLGYHKVNLNRLNKLALQKGPLAAQAKKVLRSKVTNLLGTIARDVEEHVFVSQCRAKERLREKEIQAVIFDLDGVLIDTRKLVEAAYREISRCHFQEEPKETDLRKVLNQSPPKAMRLLFKNRYKDHMYKEYDEYFSCHLADKAIVPAGVEETVNSLVSKGFTLGLVTSQPRHRMMEMLEISGFQKKFAARIHWGHTVKKKPYCDPVVKALNILKVEPGKAVYVGDDPLDIQCAKNSNVTDILALWANNYFLDELLVFSPTYLLTSPDRVCFLYDKP